MKTYNVTVQKKGRHYSSLQVNAASPMLACEAAERIVCQATEGSLDKLGDYFASSAREA